MPGFDRTGPSGRGPLTGGGRGYCIGERQINPVLRGVGRGGVPFGGGAGHCWGGGRGRWWRGQETYPAQDDYTDLEKYAEELEAELNAVKQRIKKEAKPAPKTE